MNDQELLDSASHEGLLMALVTWQVSRREISKIGQEFLPWIESAIASVNGELIRRWGTTAYRVHNETDYGYDPEIAAALKERRIDILSRIHSKPLH